MWNIIERHNVIGQKWLLIYTLNENFPVFPCLSEHSIHDGGTLKIYWRISSCMSSQSRGKQILLHIYCHKKERRYCCIFRLDCSVDGLLLPLAVHMPEAAGVWRTQKCAAQCVGGFCSMHDAAHGYWLHRQFRLLCLVYFQKLISFLQGAV